jgi:hypothetical protein
MSFRFMRAIEVPETPRDRVYRASRLHAVLFVLTCLSACVLMIWFRWPGPRAPFYISAVIVVALLLGHQFVAARFRPSNWLVRAADEGLYIHFRSYLNDHLSPEDPTVVFLPYQDTRSARLVKERTQTRDTSGGTETRYRRYVELELAVDPAPLTAALATEYARPGAEVRRWYGSSTTLYREYPVRMQSPPFLRLEWNVVPRASTFLDALRQRVEVAPMVVVSDDFTNLQALAREQQEQRLRDLDQRGQTIAAIYTAKRLYTLNTGEATKLVNGLRGGPQP